MTKHDHLKPTKSDNKVVYVPKTSTADGYYAIQQASSKAKLPFMNSMKVCKSIKLTRDDVVIDIGAYVGEYTMWCLKQGVRKIVAYEPTKATFDVLKTNIKNNARAQLINKAVVGSDNKTAELHLSNGIGITNSIAKKRSRPTSVIVDCVRYEDAIKEATVVKIDVEGLEYDYNLVQSHVRAYIIEFHVIANTDWERNALKIIKELLIKGYTAVNFPLFSSRNGRSSYSDRSGSWER